MHLYKQSSHCQVLLLYQTYHMTMHGSENVNFFGELTLERSRNLSEDKLRDNDDITENLVYNSVFQQCRRQ